jgi:lipopolysaccharide biosynthesis protein
MSNSTHPRLIAFHLPQFHPIPENDCWWGPGFTEWTNVVRAQPLFSGHYQPHLPADLGFYDLRLPEVREAQANLARQYGIHGFCYYHYWFNGRRLLERPVNEILASGEPDFPFCLCWANENWTRAWDGGEREILLQQKYSHADDVQHMTWLCRALADERYIRVDGKPLLMIYRASILPDAAATAETWREVAMRQGVGEIFLANVENFADEVGGAMKWGLDAGVEFMPDSRSVGPCLGRDRRARLLSKLGKATPFFDHSIYDYPTLVEGALQKPDPGYLRFPTVTPMWDNTARRKAGATILLGATPERYGAWLREVLRRLANRPAELQVCFVNAWNEWAEGCHLEPCQRWGRQYLEATQRALEAVCPAAGVESEALRAMAQSGASNAQ